MSDLLVPFDCASLSYLLCSFTLSVAVVGLWDARPVAAQPITEAPAEIRAEVDGRFEATPFPMGRVQLLDSPFREALRRDVDYLLLSLILL